MPLDSPAEDEVQSVPEVVSNHQPPSGGATLDPTPFSNSVQGSNSREDENRATSTKEPLTKEEVCI